MTLYAPSVTEDQVFSAVQAFILLVIPALDASHVIQGQDNRVPPPSEPEYIVLSPGTRMRLSTNIETWDATDPNPSTILITTHTQVAVQIDVHGLASGDTAQTLLTLFRSAYACQQFPANVTPLYCDEPQQLPFFGGEDQSENRWVMNLFVQVNSAVSTPSQFANKLAVTVAAPADSH